MTGQTGPFLMVEQIRGRKPRFPTNQRDLIVACMPMRSRVNPSRIARTAGFFGLKRLVLGGNVKLDPEIARSSVEFLDLSYPRTLARELEKIRKTEGFRLVGLEQTTQSQSIFDYQFDQKTVLVIGNERTGISQEVLDMLDEVVEIPVYGQPASLNAASSAMIGIYEYCRQFP